MENGKGIMTGDIKYICTLYLSNYYDTLLIDYNIHWEGFLALIIPEGPGSGLLKRPCCICNCRFVQGPSSKIDKA